MGLSMFNGNWRGFCPQGLKQFDCSSQDPDIKYKKYSIFLIREQLVGGTSWKDKGGVTWGDMGGTQGHLIKIGKTIIEIEWIFKGANKFFTIDLSNQYESTLLSCWFRMVLQST